MLMLVRFIIMIGMVVIMNPIPSRQVPMGFFVLLFTVCMVSMGVAVFMLVDMLVRMTMH